MARAKSNWPKYKKTKTTTTSLWPKRTEKFSINKMQTPMKYRIFRNGIGMVFRCFGRAISSADSFIYGCWRAMRNIYLFHCYAIYWLNEFSHFHNKPIFVHHFRYGAVRVSAFIANFFLPRASSVWYEIVAGWATVSASVSEKLVRSMRSSSLHAQQFSLTLCPSLSNWRQH